MGTYIRVEEEKTLTTKSEKLTRNVDNVQKFKTVLSEMASLYFSQEEQNNMTALQEAYNKGASNIQVSDFSADLKKTNVLHEIAKIIRPTSRDSGSKGPIINAIRILASKVMLNVQPQDKTWPIDDDFNYFQNAISIFNLFRDSLTDTAEKKILPTMDEKAKSVYIEVLDKLGQADKRNTLLTRKDSKGNKESTPSVRPVDSAKDSLSSFYKQEKVAVLFKEIETFLKSYDQYEEYVAGNLNENKELVLEKMKSVKEDREKFLTTAKNLARSLFAKRKIACTQENGEMEAVDETKAAFITEYAHRFSEKVNMDTSKIIS